MNRLILADNQVIFRTGAARVLVLEDDIRIVAQCEDLTRLSTAVDATRGAVILIGSSLQPDLPNLIAQAHSLDSRVIFITENAEQIPEDIAVQLDGCVCRNVAGPDLIDCVRRVGRGQRVLLRTNVTAMQSTDAVGLRVLERLTPKELQIVALIVQGCRNKDIANQLGTKEQVIKNYLRSIYDKSGVSDRLELALFTIHHRALAEAAARAGDQIQRKSA
jgi:DNA-binding NarL/FixJ family response regulator